MKTNDRDVVANCLARADASLQQLRRATRELRAAGQAALERRRRMTDELRRSSGHRTPGGSTSRES